MPQTELISLLSNINEMLYLIAAMVWLSTAVCFVVQTRNLYLSMCQPRVEELPRYYPSIPEKYGDWQYD